MRKLALVLAFVALGSLATGAVLYDNGPLSTGNMSSNGVAAPAGTTWSEVQPPGTIAGFGNQLSANNRVADDFTIPAGQSWTINSIDFFGYQTGASSLTLNAVNVRIWSGQPGTGTVVFGDTTTNRFNGGAFSNIYRIFTATPDQTRKIMQYNATIGTTLGAGTYWVDWQTGGTLSSGPWAPQVTILGQPGKPGANGMQQVSGASWALVNDGGVNQDFPFLINGVPEPAALALLALGLLLRRR